MATLNKKVLEKGLGKLTVKYNKKEKTYSYLNKDTIDGIVALSAVGLIAAGKQDVKDTQSPTDVSNVLANLSDYKDYYGWCQILKDNYEKNKEINLDDEKTKDIKNAFVDENDKFRELIDISFLKKNKKDLLNKVKSKSKEFEKQIDSSYKEIYDDVKSGKNNWREYLRKGDFETHWGGKDGYGFKFLGMKVDPSEYLKATGKDLVEKGIHKIENVEWNILTIGPKLLLAAWKIGSWTAAFIDSKKSFAKTVDKMKAKTVEKEINETIKKFEKAKNDKKIPE